MIGAGIVGLSIARELKARDPASRIIVLEKEDRPGRHASGRNSGVLHSGIYYPPGSIKARVCSQGAREMALYCEDRGLPVTRIGKLLVPTATSDGPQLDLLAERAFAQGIEIQRVGTKDLAELEPETVSATGEALLVPGTSVVSSSNVMAAITEEVVASGVEIRCGGLLGRVDAGRRELAWAGETLSYGHAINAAGLHADSVAHRFGLARRYTLLPFKGIYWMLDPGSGIRINRLIYPVPDLRMPFLGIHTTTTVDGTVYIGPTAVPALGRENYRGLEGTSAGQLARITYLLGRQFLSGRDDFRRLALHEARQFTKARFTRAAQALLPRLRPQHLLPCAKIGIRAQMIDRKEGRLVTDFLIESGPGSTHVLNAISPAFTGAFPLARFVCDSKISLKGENAT